MEVNKLDILVSYYRENKIAHAYLLETNNIDQCYKDLLNVIKKIFCQKEYQEKCEECNICNLIDQQFLPSLITISTEGPTIKKEQVLELKRNFSSIPVYTKENIYIIKEAEKLNDASANTMLKFLEEPEDHILGFFITTNANNVITTIKSRCEVMKVMYDEPGFSLNSVNLEYLNMAKDYLYKLEVEKNDSIMYNKSVLLNKFSERDEIKNIFNIILYLYVENLNVLMGQASDYTLDYLKNYSKEFLIKRIDLVTEFLDNLKSNANIELLLDKFVIELGEDNE